MFYGETARFNRRRISIFILQLRQLNCPIHRQPHIDPFILVVFILFTPILCLFSHYGFHITIHKTLTKPNFRIVVVCEVDEFFNNTINLLLLLLRHRRITLQPFQLHLQMINFIFHLGYLAFVYFFCLAFFAGASVNLFVFLYLQFYKV